MSGMWSGLHCIRTSRILDNLACEVPRAEAKETRLAVMIPLAQRRAEDHEKTEALFLQIG